MRTQSIEHITHRGGFITKVYPSLSQSNPSFSPSLSSPWGTSLIPPEHHSHYLVVEYGVTNSTTPPLDVSINENDVTGKNARGFHFHRHQTFYIYFPLPLRPDPRIRESKMDSVFSRQDVGICGEKTGGKGAWIHIAKRIDLYKLGETTLKFSGSGKAQGRLGPQILQSFRFVLG
ncbi:hypothetical protein KQX54_004285 [Cotesia glomerata]|uniref:Uncharacterized protein n=1 Tax=Cotesia glomerata TaxID=32391 RepID=A0AAV7IJW9_COTGL|nr:hypothetical protein KQX54_004285 [Cotesia glomerata]